MRDNCCWLEVLERHSVSVFVTVLPVTFVRIELDTLMMSTSVVEYMVVRVLWLESYSLPSLI